jgi:hypothetical protein
VQKYRRARQATYKTAHAVCMLGYKYTFRICNTAFQPQQSLNERALALRYTYIACLVSACSRMHVQIVVSVLEAGGKLISLG